MKYYEIKKNLFLVEQEIVKKEKPAKPEPVNHIWIYDRSGSMRYDLPKLTEDLITKSKEIPTGDTITLGWFSGEGQFNFILKGFRVTEERDYKVLENAIHKNNTTVGCTCFSEVLSESKNVINDLSVFSDKFSLLFFTDGYPVVSNYSKEIKAIQQAVSALEGSVSTSCLVGYGNYYNKELMAEMAENLGGCLIHSSNLEHFNLVLSDIIKNTLGSDGKIEVILEAPSSEGVVFGVNDKTINIYKAREDQTIRYAPTKETIDRVYTLTDKVKSSYIKLTLTQQDLMSPKPETASFVQSLYAVACILNQKAKTDLAIDTLASIGEVGFIDLLTNSFTNKEHGIAEESLREALVNLNARYSRGYNASYLPDPEAFCLLDALELLMKDDKASFYPYHPKFKYTSIGLASKPKGVYPKFQADSLTKCAFSNLTWNDTKLNLSVQARISGTIGLIGDARKLGFSQTYPTYIFRNYALVKDGFLNMDSIPVSLSKETFDILQGHRVIDSSENYKEDQIYDLNLKAIPVINRSISEGSTSATELSRKVFEELQYKAQLKVLNDYKKDLTKKEGVVDDIFKGMTEEQITFLQTNGITKNGFSPETEKADPVDFYMVKEFDIKVKGFSSLPKVADVQTKLASKKALRPVEEIMKTGIDILENSPVKGLDNKVVLAWLDSETKKIKNKMLKTRFDVQKKKFAIILGKKWFNEFTSRENCDLVVDNNTFSFVLTETKVNI